MCGITGFLLGDQSQADSELRQTVQQMSHTLRHRGPDDSGTWVDEQCGVALGFRRLAILDLSPTGHQPMRSPNERYVIVFNGEIYNFPDLRVQLSQLGARFVGTSDTEVILAAVCEWGVLEAIRQLNGMFALAIWDGQERYLWLARDRVGIKPLYYGWTGRVFLFGSELKALAEHPDFQAEINRDALVAYLRFGYVPAPCSIYQQIAKLKAGTLLRIQNQRGFWNQETYVYWSAQAAAEGAASAPFMGEEQEARAELDMLLRRSVRERMIADVPLGTFLSGGIDSSTIVALMQQQSTRPVKTFTIGFENQHYNEAVYAAAVARHLQTDHTEIYVDEQKTIEVIPRLPTFYDEPFADSSQIPTFLVSELARQDVTVCLSGDGGDELFAGYTRYLWARKIRAVITALPRTSRQPIQHTLQALLQHERLIRAAERVLPVRHAQPNLGLKLRAISDLFESVTSNGVLKLLTFHHCDDPEGYVLRGTEPDSMLTDPSQWPSGVAFTELQMYLDLLTYLPDDILAKVDRASMAHSLEVRVPFLDDHRIIEFAWSLPLTMKIHGHQGKHILRQVLYQYLPRHLVDRPKMGFLIPIEHWLCDGLRDWAECLLDERKLSVQGFLQPKRIRRVWQDYLANKNGLYNFLWDVLMFQAWLEVNAK